MESTESEHRYTALLITLFALYVISPFVQIFFASRQALILLDLLVTATLLAATYAVHRRTSTLIIASFFALPAIAGRWASYAVQSQWLFGLSQVCGFLFLAFTSAAILNSILRPAKVTTDIVNGAICVYMMIAVAWAFLFSLLEVFQPESFKLPALLQVGEDIAYMDVRRLSIFMYYSLVTLTTLGYGDITPITHPARNLAALEAVVGQLFIAVLIARLVGLRVVHSGQDEDKKLKV